MYYENCLRYFLCSKKCLKIKLGGKEVRDKWL